MKKLIAPLVILAAAFSLVSISRAQSTGSTGGPAVQTQTAQKPRANREKMMADVLTKLNLNTDQKTKIKALRDKNQAALKDLRQQVKAGTLQKADAAKKRQELNKETTKSLKTILTKDQAKQFAAMMKEAREKAKEDKHGTAPIKSGGTTPPAKTGGN